MSASWAPSAVAAGEPWREALDQAVKQAVAGNLEASRDSLLKLEKEYPDQPEIIRRTAQVLARTDQRAEAIKRFRQLISLSPDSLTDREDLLVVLLWDGQTTEYAKERHELLAAFKAAGDNAPAHSPNFVRELFAVDQTINVDAYEYYPGTHSGPVTPYYLFVVTDSNGTKKGHFVVAENSDKTAEMKAKGDISDTDRGFYMEFRQPVEQSNTQAPVLVTSFPGAHPPTYDKARQAVIAYIAAHLES